MPKKTKQAKKQKKLNIFFNISENSGVGYYRQYLQAVALKEQGLANVLINDFTWGEVRMFCQMPDCKVIINNYDAGLAVTDYVKHLKEIHNKVATEEETISYRSSLINMVQPTPETLNKIGHWADLLVVGREDSSNYLSQWKGISQFFNIPLVWDTDDNVHATRPFNPGYRGYYPGAESLMWNKKMAQEVDAITVSTENLKGVHSKDNPNIYVIPNSVEFIRWKNCPKPKFKEIRIGMLVSASHHEDSKLLEKVIPVILKKYPQVHFYFSNLFNYVFLESCKDVQSQMNPIPWSPLKTWPDYVCNLGLEIGLAPLVDNMFNRAKSNLRYLEYSAAEIATIASPIEPYRETIKDGKTGLFAYDTQDWISKISMLVEDEKYRKKFASSANKFVEKNFDIDKNVGKFLQYYIQIVKDFKKNRGKRKFDLQKNAFKEPEKAFKTTELVK